MSAESSLYSLLSGASGVRAIVNLRIYPDALPEECIYPAIAFSRTKTDPINGVSGQCFGADVDLAVGCWGNTRGDADAAADAVEASLTSTAFRRIDRESTYDPEMALHAALVTVTTFEN